MTDRSRAVFWRALLVALGAWSIAPPYLGPELGLELDVSSSVEFVDHVVPGVVVVIFGAVALFMARAGASDSLLAMGATGVCLLAGFWATVSHIPLWADAGGEETPWGAVLLHATAGPAITVLALWLLLGVVERT